MQPEPSAQQVPLPTPPSEIEILAPTTCSHRRKWRVILASLAAAQQSAETCLYERPIERTTGAAPDFSVIRLHGLGADGTDFVRVIPELALPASLAGGFIFPHEQYSRVPLSQSAHT